MIGLTLLILALHGRTLRSAGGLGVIFGLTFYLPLLWWTTIYVGGIATALAVAEALLTAPAVALMASATRRLPGWPFWVAAIWTAGEALRARAPFGGFPWGAVAFSQVDGPLLPAASLIGAPGLTFITVLTAGGLAALIRRIGDRPRVRPIAVLLPLATVIFPFGVGAAGLMTTPAESAPKTAQIAVIQGNVPEPGLDFNARRRAVTDMHAQQTRALAAAVRAGTQPAPKLVIWPENSSDLDPYRNPDAYAVIDAAVKEIGVPVLIGAVIRNGEDSPGTYNQGIVWDPVTGPGQSYTKRHPVPFAEYMPYRSFFRLFSAWVDSAGYFIPGHTPGNLDIAGVNVGDVICFEIVYDDLVRDIVNGGAQLIVVQTNNATFGYTNETYQQQAMSRVRAVEHRRQVLIAATSGISAVIRPDGSVEQQVGLFQPGYMNTTTPLLEARTPATRLGAPIEGTLTIGSLLALVAPARVRHRPHRPPGHP